MTNCQQKPNITVFRVSPAFSKTGDVHCLTLSTGVPVNTKVDCGKAAVLEHIHIWGNKTFDVAGVLVRDSAGEKAWTKFWAAANTQLVIKFEWKAEYVAAQNPQVCLVMRKGVNLDSLCVGEGTCTLALHSIDKGKCCPVYTLPVPAPLAPVA